MAGDPLAPQPLRGARALDPRFYTADTMRVLDRDAVFRTTWHLVGHAGQIPEAGDHLVVETALAPVVVLRTVDGTIRAFHNVCRHRAGPLALCDGKGAKALHCKYHGWTYTLDGELRSAPEMTPLREHGLEGTRLHGLEVAVWHDLVFVAEACAVPFPAYSAGWEGPLRSLSPAGYRFHRRIHYDVACNWKVYCDNYLEGYHVPHIHPGLNALLDYRQYVTEAGDWFSFQHSPLESADGLYGDGDAVYYFLHPNTMLNLLPGRLQVNRVIPLGVDRCRVYFEYYYRPDDSPEGVARREADRAFSHEVQLEDLGICEHVQRGLESGAYEPGVLNPLRENAVHHFHELLRRAYREARAE